MPCMDIGKVSNVNAPAENHAMRCDLVPCLAKSYEYNGIATSIPMKVRVARTSAA